MNTYRNYVPVAYPPSDKGMPVPGWDMRARLAGSRTIAIGAGPMDSVIDSSLDSIWAKFQPKMRAELDLAIADAQKSMRRDMVIATAVLAVVIVAAEMIEWKKIKLGR